MCSCTDRRHCTSATGRRDICIDPGGLEYTEIRTSRLLSGSGLWFPRFRTGWQGEKDAWSATELLGKTGETEYRGGGR